MGCDAESAISEYDVPGMCRLSTLPVVDFGDHLTGLLIDRVGMGWEHWIKVIAWLAASAMTLRATSRYIFHHLPIPDETPNSVDLGEEGAPTSSPPWRHNLGTLGVVGGYMFSEFFVAARPDSRWHHGSVEG